MKDHCVICKVETAYDENTHVDIRLGYIEGLGQLCSSCYSRGTEHGAVAIDYSTILSTPNNQELGAKVRQTYWESRSL